MAADLDLTILTARERLIVDLLIQGLGTKEIAMRLGKAASTVSTQKKSAMRKLKVGSTVELAMMVKMK